MGPPTYHPATANPEVGFPLEPSVHTQANSAHLSLPLGEVAEAFVVHESQEFMAPNQVASRLQVGAADGAD